MDARYPAEPCLAHSPRSVLVRIEQADLLGGVNIGAVEPSDELKVRVQAVCPGHIEECQYVVWNDGSMGCAKEGELYTMALIPGYKITVRDGEELHVLHTDEAGLAIRKVS